VPTQYIAGYRDSFFQRGTLHEFFYDFTIPASAQVLKNLILAEGEAAQDFTIHPSAKYSDLVAEKTAIEVQGRPGRTTLVDVWNETYPETFIVPRADVINLPANARDIFTLRTEKINSLRRANIAREGMDTNDAARELKMMGYTSNAKASYINPKTGKRIDGLIAGGYTYYSALKHKVKNKVQARGLGKKDQLKRQPIAGRNFEGGLRFNHADALASYRSGAVNFVADRLLNASSKTDIYVCTTCKSICYKEEGGMKGIVCPLCKVDAKAIKISVPYIFMLERNLLMGAGVNLLIDVVADDRE